MDIFKGKRDRHNKRLAVEIIEDKIKRGELPPNKHPYYNFNDGFLISVNLNSYSEIKVPVKLVRESISIIRSNYIETKDAPFSTQVALDFLRGSEWYSKLSLNDQKQINFKSFTEMIFREGWYEPKNV